MRVRASARSSNGARARRTRRQPRSGHAARLRRDEPRRRRRCASPCQSPNASADPAATGQTASFTFGSRSSTAPCATPTAGSILAFRRPSTTKSVARPPARTPANRAAPRRAAPFRGASADTAPAQKKRSAHACCTANATPNEPDDQPPRACARAPARGAARRFSDLSLASPATTLCAPHAQPPSQPASQPTAKRQNETQRATLHRERNAAPRQTPPAARSRVRKISPHETRAARAHGPRQPNHRPFGRSVAGARARERAPLTWSTRERQQAKASFVVRGSPLVASTQASRSQNFTLSSLSTTTS